MLDGEAKDIFNLLETSFEGVSKRIPHTIIHATFSKGSPSKAKEKIELYGKTYEVEHFKLTSKDMSIPKDKRLNFDIWFDKKNALILKVAYSRMGNWEYRVKKFE